MPGPYCGTVLYVCWLCCTVFSMHVLCIALNILCVLYNILSVTWLHVILGVVPVLHHASSLCCAVLSLYLCHVLSTSFPCPLHVLTHLDLAVFPVLQFVPKMLSVLFYLCFSVFSVLYYVQSALHIALHVSLCFDTWFSVLWCVLYVSVIYL